LGYRSRAAFKLIELAARDKLLQPGMSVVDLGAAPGSWCQVLRERLGPRGRIVALDVLPLEPIAGVVFVQGDFRDKATLQALEAALAGHKVDLVLSDLAPNISGIESADQARSVYLGELALEFSSAWLQPGAIWSSKPSRERVLPSCVAPSGRGSTKSMRASPRPRENAAGRFSWSVRAFVRRSEGVGPHPARIVNVVGALRRLKEKR